MSVRILIGDMRERLRDLPDASVDSCVCDPPYHLTSIVKRFGSATAAPAKVGKTGAYARASKGFMGQTWDGGDVAFDPETWAEVLRVLKPGGFLLAFGGDRTFHRLAVAIEDAGFEYRGTLSWIFGSGFPKSRNVSKDLADLPACSCNISSDRSSVVNPIPPSSLLGATVGTESVSVLPTGGSADRTPGHGLEGFKCEACGGVIHDRIPQGLGTALKPAMELIAMARKPLDGTVAGNVLRHGTGALNIDGCRIDVGDGPVGYWSAGTEAGDKAGKGYGGSIKGGKRSDLGRWPANIIHDGSDKVLAGFPETEGAGNLGGTRRGELGYHGGASGSEMPAAYDAGGSAARFFQQCEWGEEDGYGLPEVQQNNAPADVSCGRGNLRGEGARRFKYCPKATTEERGEGNNHPTVKPVALMRWLVRLVTPAGGTVLDPFAGSGSTLIAADAEQFNAIGCELSPEYAEIARKRIARAAGMFADISVECTGPSSQAAA